MTLRRPTFGALCFAGLLVRLVCIAYGVWHDAHHALKYTDVDYNVFSDATSFLLHPAQGNQAAGPLGRHLQLGSPYTRETYRYTPLLALLLTPNHVHPLWGKLLFSLADVGICILLYNLLQLRHSRNPKMIVSIAWLFNPMPINIATRGSSEALLGLVVLACLYAAEKRRWLQCGLLLGLATHFKIYPGIYAISLVCHLARGDYRKLVSRQIIKLGSAAFCAFMLLNAAMYTLWGEPFLQETYLYHIHRLDHRHNFSSAFYPIMLSAASDPISSFVPQVTITACLGAVFSQDLALAWFLQTAAFVTFNKVCTLTSKYFLWYLWLLPLIVERLVMSRRESLTLVAVWVGGQAIWLKFGYDLEMLGRPVHYQLWLASLLFQLINIAIISRIIDASARHQSAQQKTKSA